MSLVMGAFGRVGSLRLTLVLLILLAAGVFAYLFYVDEPWLIAAPLLLLALNLLAAIVANPAFRRSIALLSFHLALLLLLLLITVGRMTQLKGHTEVASGERFEALVDVQSGPWHKSRLADVRFVLDRFTIDYIVVSDEVQRDTTRAYIRWRDHLGIEQKGVVGDHTPLTIYGYRFYTTPNKGFAPVFIWQDEHGISRQGVIHLPSYPAHKHTQSLDWTIPGTSHNLWTQLQFDEVILDPQRPSQFRVPKDHLLVVRVGERRHELKPGQSIDFPDGHLTYKELRTWMGFAVFYDWTLPWLFAAGLVAVLSLGWHYWRKFDAKPWLQEEPN